MRGSAGLAWQQQQQQHKYASLQQHSRQRVMQLSLVSAVPSCRHLQHRSSTGSVQLHRPSVAAQAAVSTKHAAADPCLELTGVQSKAAGSLVAAMCGNALGAQVEPEKVGIGMHTNPMQDVTDCPGLVTAVVWAEPQAFLQRDMHAAAATRLHS
jgi:hypothetical protein